MKTRLLALLLIVALPLAGEEKPVVDSKLQNKEWLMDVLLYAYYWYLDDGFFIATQDVSEIEVWVRNVEPVHRDAGDQSRFAEIWLPQAHALLHLKQADYRIDELDLPVHSEYYRVVHGGFENVPPGSSDDWKVITLPRKEVSEALRSGRHQLHVPAPPLKQIALEAIRREMDKPGGDTSSQTLFIAARTAVSSEIWVYWANRRTIFHIAGDMDVIDPALMKRLPLLVHQYHLGSDIVASTLEAKGSNAVLSRDYASRVLFVCLARGEEITLQPESH